MEDILLSQKQYQALIKRLDEIKGDVTSIRLRSETDGNFLDEYDLIKLFHVSKRTVLRWRKSGRLPYSKIGHKFYYKVDAILEYLRIRPDSEIKKEHPQVEDNNLQTNLCILEDSEQKITCERCPLFVIFNF